MTNNGFQSRIFNKLYFFCPLLQNCTHGGAWCMDSCLLNAVYRSTR